MFNKVYIFAFERELTLTKSYMNGLYSSPATKKASEKCRLLKTSAANIC